MRGCFISVLALFSAFVLGGCGGATPAPEAADRVPTWVYGSHGYSSDYLVGFGSGSSPTVAADRARSDLAKTISVSVESAERSTKSSTSAGGYDASFSSAVFSHANQTIEGVEIAERYYDKVGDAHFALAVLDRNKAAARLSGELRQKDLEVDSDLAAANGETNALGRLKLLNSAAKILEDRGAIAAVLSVVGKTPAAPNLAQTEIAERRRAALAAVKISVSGDETAKKLLSGALSDLGFSIARGGEYEANGDFSESSRYENGWHWAKAAIAVKLSDRGSGEVAGSYLFEAEESSQSAKTAADRAIKKLRSDLAAQLLDKIGGD